MIDPTVKSTDEVEALLKQFHPKFGNDNHIAILKQYNEVLHLRSLMKSDDTRRLEMKKITKSNRARVDEITRKESGLLWLLKRELSPE